MAASSTRVVASPELEYKPYSYRHGTKMYTQLYQQTGGQTVTVPITTVAESIFEIPIKAFSLPDSYIRGLATPTTGGAGAYNWFHEISHLASEYHLYTRGGQYLAQVLNAPNYSVMTRGWNTPLSEFLTADDVDRYYPSRAAGTDATTGGRLVGTVAPEAPYTEMNYAQIGGPNTATPVIPFTIHLGHLKDTIFALNKALLMPEVILLKVVWGPLQKFSWIGTAATVPATGHVPPAGNLAITNLSMFLAIETDPGILLDLASAVTTGYRLAIPYVHSRVIADGGAGTSKSLTIKVTPDMGFALKRLIYAPFNSTETLETAFDHDNRNGAKILTYQTTLDSVQRQQYLVNCQANFWDDWLLMSKFCKGTAIQARDIYQYNWVHIEDFSDLSVTRVAELDAPKDNIISGQPIVGSWGSERLWTYIATTPNVNNNHYVFIVTYKTLVITPGSGSGGTIIVTPAPPS